MPTFVNVTRLPRSRIVASQPFPQPTCSDANLERPDVGRKGSWAMQSRRFSGLPLIGILAVIYFVAGKLGLMLASLHASASPVWPPAGIALAGSLLLGYRAWPAIFIGAFLVNVTTAGNVATSFAIEDRKSTRLNSSHRCISYAVFCLKK